MKSKITHVYHVFYDFHFIHANRMIYDINLWKDRLWDDAEHTCVVLYKKQPEKKLTVSNVMFVEGAWRLFFVFFKFIMKGQNMQVIIHGGDYRLWRVMALWPKLMLARTKWICWGPHLQSDRTGLKSWIYFRVRSHIFRNLKEINFLMNSDCEKFHLTFRNNHTRITPYFSSNYDYLFSLPVTPVKEIVSLNNVLIGNNGFPLNKHFEVFEIVSQSMYTNNVQLDIHTLVSYGPGSYINKVNDKGFELFGSKYKPKTDLVSENEIVDYYSTLDSLIIYSDVQTGLFVIYCFIFLAKPVYLKSDTLISKWLDYLDIYYLDVFEFGEISKIESGKLLNNREKMRYLLNSDNLFYSWKMFFNY